MQMIKCPQCPAENLPAYAESHAAWHTYLTRKSEENRRADAAANAAYGPVRKAA